MNVDQALSLLWQAARPSPHLREAVELIETEIARLRAEVETLRNSEHRLAERVAEIDYDDWRSLPEPEREA